MVYSLLITVLLLYAAKTDAGAQLTWSLTDNEVALCNDFTRAGFFHRPPGITGGQNWVVFLESGSLCYSNETCNRRYFQSHLRDRYSTDIVGQNPFGNFDTAVAWAETGAAGRPLEEVVNPLMTSPYCFKNETQFFINSDSLSVEGKDILSSDCEENPTFCNHGHVLVPYCSSDLWLGSDDRQDKQCDCWDQNCFRYNPTSEDLQFTFRGQTIFRSVLQTLDRLYDLKTASEIVLVGSSAGGVGVLNSAKWVRDNFQNVSLKVIADSSWFINFRGSIVQEFGSVSSAMSFSGLLNVVGSIEACNDIRQGYPCCLSAECLLKPNKEGEYYIPQGVSVFALTSVYDVFLLANAISRLVPVRDEFSVAGLALQFTTTMGEYGGAMNGSLLDAADTASLLDVRFSYFATQCFQHIYFSMSSLRSPNGLLGTDEIQLGSTFAMFEHNIESGVWNREILGYYNGTGHTIRSAIDLWYNHSEESLVFRDVCSGPHCSNACPEQIALSENEENNWSLGVKIVIAAVVLLIGVTCLVMKMYCCIWRSLLYRKQQLFLAQTPSYKGEEPATVKPQQEFPSCTDEEAISVACLDLHYSVTVRGSGKKKFEKKEAKILPAVLSELQDNGDLTDTIGTEGKRADKQFEEWNTKKKMTLAAKTKRILNGISAYFNPGELIAILGPSGCGKTTFLDLLTGRRKTGTTMGNIFVNGFPMEKNQTWYVSNTGYVLQLAAPYYEELTVRENLTLAAWVKLHISSREKFQRVEQVMEVTGLMDLADIVVGGATGPGLSGGQKRRLVVALQLLKLPSVIFLDEPTSGLDSASATELLTHLNALAASNRTVVLTIHQPRLEIFHMFNRIVVLTDGKVAYHGVPEKAYEVFVDALQSAFLSQGVKIPTLEDHNPADIIMDMLGDGEMRKIVNSYYEDSGEPKRVRKAVDGAWEKEQMFNPGDEIDGQNTLFCILKAIGFKVKGSRQAGRTHNYSIVRLAALETRAMKRANLVTILYLPIIFFGYGFLLGTVYFQTTQPFLIMSGFCVYSVASALFMFPPLYTFYTRALEIYTFEHADGAGRASDLVIQPFVRFISMAFFPVIICAGVLYVLAVDYTRWNGIEFLQLALVNLALNQTWTSLLIWLILTFPVKSFRLSPVLSALAGFTSGFFIPINKIPWWYRWLSFINPNFYGFSASAVILLSDFESDCERDGGSELECYTASGDYILAAFSFDTINAYKNIVILLAMTVFFLLLAVLSNWIRYVKFDQVLKRIMIMLSNTGLRTPKYMFNTSVSNELGRASSHESEVESLSDDEEVMETGEDEEFANDVCEEGPTQAKLAWIRLFNEFKLSQEKLPDAQKNTRQRSTKTKSIRQKQDKQKALYLVAGESHSVWTPRKPSLKQPAFSDVAMEVVRNKQDLQERQKRMRSRVMATQLVLKVQREELKKSEEGEEEGEVDDGVQTRKNKGWRNVIKRVVEENTKAKQRKRSKRSLHFHEVVSQYAEKMAKPNQNDEETAESTACQAKADARQAINQWRTQHLDQSKRSKTPLKPFSSVADIQVQQPAFQHRAYRTTK